MAKHNVYHKFTTVSAIVLGGGVSIVGVALLLLSSQSFMDALPTWRAFVSNLGGVLAATGIISIGWELFGRRQFAAEVYATAKLSQDVYDSGLSRLAMNFQNEVEWPLLLDDAKHLDLFVAYASTWRKSNIQYLQSMAGRSGCRVRLVLPDPDNKSIVGHLAARFGMELGDVEGRIRESEREFRQLFEGGKGKLEIWYSHKAPVLTFYRIDHQYVMTTYRHRNGRGDILTLVCQGKGSVTHFIRDELDALLDESYGIGRKVYPPPTLPPGIYRSDTENPAPEGHSGGDGI